MGIYKEKTVNFANYSLDNNSVNFANYSSGNNSVNFANYSSDNNSVNFANYSSDNNTVNFANNLLVITITEIPDFNKDVKDLAANYNPTSLTSALCNLKKIIVLTCTSWVQVYNFIFDTISTIKS